MKEAGEPQTLIQIIIQEDGKSNIILYNFTYNNYN